jgi:DNA-damage-inducible protein J
MAKTASLNIRLDPNTKHSAEALFSQFGITVADAVSIFLNKSLMEGGLPFDVKQPRYNEETLEALAEVRRMKANPAAYKGYDDVDVMMGELLQ